MIRHIMAVAFLVSAFGFGTALAFADGFGAAMPGSVRLIYGVTINCWSKASKLQLDPALPQNLFLYAELKDGKIGDLTRYIKFRNEKKR